MTAFEKAIEMTKFELNLEFICQISDIDDNTKKLLRLMYDKYGLTLEQSIQLANDINELGGG